MNIVIFDNETETILFGQTVLNQIVQTRQAQHIKEYHLPAEAWISFLRYFHKQHKEVQEYLRLVDSTGFIDPDKGRSLKAIDDILDISEEQADALYKMVEENSD